MPAAIDTPTAAAANPASRTTCSLARQLLLRPAGDQPALTGLLAELAGAFGASGAGLATLGSGQPACRFPVQAAAPTAWPWETDPTLLKRTRQAPGAVTVESAGASLALTSFVDAGFIVRVLWLEQAAGQDWNEELLADLALAGDALARWLQTEARPRWADQLDRCARQQQLETAAQVSRRLAHDFGNLLTGILGFTELALAQQLPTNTPLPSYLDEVYRSAQNGALFTQQLRLFSRRQAPGSRQCSLAAVLAEQQTRLQAARDAGLHLRLDLPPDLPPLAIDADQLQQVLTAVLDNAREAIHGPGTISVAARQIHLTAADCPDLYGAAQPGPHVEVIIADTGSGLSPEAQRRLFTEAFFSNKPRHRGFGLAIAYGVLHAHRGGLRLYPGEEYGVVARIVVPVAAIAVAAAEQPVRPSLLARGERLLVVHDDLELLRQLTRTLEQTGYRVQAVTSTEAALQRYFSDSADPFRLVISEVAMPVLNGLEMARRLLRHDPAVRLLFLSERARVEPLPHEFNGQAAILTSRPFQPEQLVRAVRAALPREKGSAGASPAAR